MWFDTLDTNVSEEVAASIFRVGHFLCPEDGSNIFHVAPLYL
jgi:hypothetical protein